MNLLALIPARGASKGIPRKNIKLLNGKPLIGWTIDAALRASSINRIVVSTDDEEVASIAKDFGADVPFIRPSQIAEDDTPGIEPALHAIDQLPDFDWILLLQPTSPFRSAADIDGIVKYCLEHNAPSAVSVSKVHKHPYWMYQRSNLNKLQPLITNKKNTSRRQDLTETYVLNGALYLAHISWLKEQQSFVSQETLGYIMSPETSVDIDTPMDWQWVEFLIERGYGK